MPKLRVHNLSVSLDGYAAGPDQTVDNPLGVGGEQLHEWVFKTPYGLDMLGMDSSDAAATLDEEMMRAGDTTSARPSWDATCSARSGTSGRMSRGPAGGVRNRRTTTKPSCSPTTHARLWRWPAARCSTSSPMASRRRSIELSTRRPERMYALAAARPPSSSTCAPTWSTRCTSQSSRWCWATGKGSWTTSPGRARGPVLRCLAVSDACPLRPALRSISRLEIPASRTFAESNCTSVRLAEIFRAGTGRGGPAGGVSGSRLNRSRYLGCRRCGASCRLSVPPIPAARRYGGGHTDPSLDLGGELGRVGRTVAIVHHGPCLDEHLEFVESIGSGEHALEMGRQRRLRRISSSIWVGNTFTPSDDHHVVTAAGHLLHPAKAGPGGARQQSGEIPGPVSDHRHRLLGQRGEDELTPLALGQHRICRGSTTSG